MARSILMILFSAPVGETPQSAVRRLLGGTPVNEVVTGATSMTTGKGTGLLVTLLLVVPGVTMADSKKLKWEYDRHGVRWILGGQDSKGKGKGKEE